ncbi:MAG: PAS domain S-box protein, partial [Methyloligellaceae bacterium]
MFDGRQRLIFGNKRYASMYGIPHENFVPGITLSEIVQMRIRNGIIAGDCPEAYVAEREQWASERTRSQDLHHLSDGRTIAVERQFLPDGGWIATHTDITDHLALQDELRDSREKHTRLLETLNVVPWEFDWATQRFVYVGPQAAQFGYPIADWYGDGFWTSIIHPDDRKDAMAFCVAATERGEDHDFEYRIMKADGSTCWVRDIVSVVSNNGGAPILRGIFVDIGEQKQAEHDLRKREAELQLIFDNVPVRILYKDDKNRILRLNKQAARSIGLSVKEAEGASVYDLFPEMARKYHEDDLEVINSNVPKLGIVQEYTPRDGERGWVVTDKVPFIDEETGRRFVFASSVDITAQKQAERELLHNKGWFKDIAETASDWFWETDQNHRFTYISKRFHEITGVEPDKILGHSRFELAGGAGANWEAHRADLQARRAFRDFRYQVTSKRGETRCWSTSGKPILEEDGRFRGYRGSGSDRTIEERALRVLSKSHDQLQEDVARATAELRAKTEELALALAKEKELNELQRQFVSMASHEFRTPLAIIDSTAQRLKSRA